MTPFLQSLVTLMTKYVPKKSDIIYFDAHTGEENPYEKSVRLIRERKVFGDNAPDKYLGYGEDGPAFRKHISRLRKQLLNTILLADYSETKMSMALKAELDCARMLYQARLLMALYEFDAGIEMARKVCSLAEEMGLAGPVLSSLALLQMEASESGEHEELERLQAKTAIWLGRQAAEARAKGYYELMKVEFIKSASQKPWLAEKAFGWAALVEKDLEQHDSPVLLYEKQRLMYAGHHCAKEYREAIAEMDTLKAYYDIHKYFAGNTRYAEIALNKLDCYMHLPDYETGRECANMCKEYFWPDSENWLYFMGLYFLFAMLTSEYTEAGAIISDAENATTFASLKDFQKEKWRLYKDYHNYATGKWETGKTFSAEKFINNYEALTHDKSGHNAAIYIMAWCMKVRHSDLWATGSREALKKYRTRHLGESENHRLNIFLKMMETADRLEYNYEKVLEKTAGLLKELENTAKSEYTGNFEGVEIIPLETLWAMAMEDEKNWELRIMNWEFDSDGRFHLPS